MRNSRLVIALVIAAISLATYFGSTSENPLTGEKQRVAMTPEQEIALGYRSAPQMAAQMGGLSQNAKAGALVRQVGEKLLRSSFAAKSPYKFSFHVIADPRTVNAFALPGGPVFVTEGLLSAVVVGSGDYSTAQIGQVVGSMINMKYGRDDELESDRLGLRIMAEAGYDPRAMIRVMEALAQASGGSRQPEFVSTHPAPENRAARIKEEIAKLPAGNFERR